MTDARISKAWAKRGQEKREATDIANCNTAVSLGSSHPRARVHMRACVCASATPRSSHLGKSFDDSAQSRVDNKNHVRGKEVHIVCTKRSNDEISLICEGRRAIGG